MDDRKIYVVAKVFDQQGCIAYLCKSLNEDRCLPGTLEALRADGVQIVILDSPEIYSECPLHTKPSKSNWKQESPNWRQPLRRLGSNA